MQYNDFTILISSDGDGQYTVRSESESYGESGPIPLSLPEKRTLDELRDRFESRTTDRKYLESIGRELYERIISGKTRDSFLLSLGEVRKDSDRGLRLRFRIGPPEIAVLPWELLYSDLDAAFVGTRTKTPLVRYLDMLGPRRELSVPYPIRVLVIIPLGNTASTKLDAESETSIIERAVAQIGDKVELTFLHLQHDDHRVTWQRIAECLAEIEFHCIHFVGHGTFHNEHGYLVLDDDKNQNDMVDDERFAELFANSPSVKLVVLNACNGATLSSSQPLAGSAARLVRHGVPAVVAMQFSVYDDAAVAFSRSFYHSLFVSDNRGRVDVAVSRGRQILAAKYSDQRELGAPVLFMHANSDVLIVPESKGLLANLPKNSAQLDTLDAARVVSSSDKEIAKYGRRIKVAKRSVQAGLALGVLMFLMAMVRILDVFTIDTQAEFAVMALGGNLAEHRVSSKLTVLTVAGGDLSRTELRERIAEIIGVLDAVGARVIALDVMYSSEGGDFKFEPESGPIVVAAVRAASTPVVIGASRAVAGMLDTPDSVRSEVAAVGFVCVETKLGLARSLPISALASGMPYSSFALEAVAEFEAGRILPGLQGDDDAPVLLFSDRPSVRFGISEVNTARRRVKTCELIDDGDLVAHRFIRRTPDDMLAEITTTFSDLKEDLASAPAAVSMMLRDKLVLVGVLGREDTVPDRAGIRDGVMWQADAINNLLLREDIAPMSDGYQLILMLILAGLAVALSLQLAGRTRRQIAALGVTSIAVVLFAVYLYGRHGVLLNPVYGLLAVWVAWWVAKRFGKTWLTN